MIIAICDPLRVRCSMNLGLGDYSDRCSTKSLLHYPTLHSLPLIQKEELRETSPFTIPKINFLKENCNSSLWCGWGFLQWNEPRFQKALYGTFLGFTSVEGRERESCGQKARLWCRQSKVLRTGWVRWLSGCQHFLYRLHSLSCPWNSWTEGCPLTSPCAHTHIHKPKHSNP